MTEREWTEDEKKEFRRKAAEYVRAVYVQERRFHEEQRTGVPSNYGVKKMVSWDGGIDSYGHKRRMIWGRIFDFCVDNALPIEQYIRAQFSPYEFAPSPNQLQSAAAVRRYKAHRKTIVEDLRRVLSDAQQRFKVLVSHSSRTLGKSREQAARHVLLTDRSLSWLFRYSMAVLAGDTEVIKATRDHATLEFMLAQQDYRQAWGDFIPREMEQEAQAAAAQRPGGEGNDASPV